MGTSIAIAVCAVGCTFFRSNLGIVCGDYPAIIDLDMLLFEIILFGSVFFMYSCISYESNFLYVVSLLSFLINRMIE